MIKNSLIEVASFTPCSLQSPNAWVGHLPFAAWVIKEVSPKVFVELGTHTGNSYFSFCQSVIDSGIRTKCFAVDTWQGDEHAGHYSDDIFDQVSAYHQENFSEFSRLLRMPFDDAVNYFSDKSIDLLHIDGLHTYAAVKHDFETWQPKLSAGAVVIFHDTNVRERNFGVWKFWEELQSKYPNSLEFLHSNGLGVLQIENAPPDRKLEWLQANSPEKQQIINYFASIGLRQLERFDLNEEKKLNSYFTHAISEKDQQILDLTSAISEKDQQILDLTSAISEKDQQILDLTSAISEKDQQILDLTSAIALRDFHLKSLLSSTSWKILAPMRYFSRWVRALRI